MRKPLSEYGAQKSTATTCARRMAEVLGEDLVKDKGLNVKFIIANKPIDDPVSERAIPVIIFQTEPSVMRSFIKKWCKDAGIVDFDMRNLIDWDYYKERVGSSILKIVTIPAALQGCENPFPKVPYPEWLKKRVKELNSIFKQKKLSDFMKVSRPKIFLPSSSQNIEDIGKSKAKIRELTDSEKKVLEERQEKERQKELERKRIQDEENNPIAIEDDFGGWLRCQKRFWRKYRKERKIDPLKAGNQTGIVSMMKNFDQVFLNSTLQVLQVQRTLIPGILKLWVRLSNNMMYPITLKTNRKFYIHSKIEQPGGTKVNKTLPRDKTTIYSHYNLYEVEQEEEVFMKNYNALMHYHISNVDIDGVYETHVPLDYRAILECGSFIKPRASKIDKTESALNRTYKVNEFEAVNINDYRSFGDISKIYVFYSHTQKYNFIGVYIPSMKHVSIFTISENKISKYNNSFELKFKKSLASFDGNNSISYEKFEYKHFLTLEEAFSNVDGKIRDYKSKNKTSFMAIIHSASPIDKIISYGLTSLNGEVPYLTSEATFKDNNFPALEWAYYATERFCKRLSTLDSWFFDKESFSFHSGVPIGNISFDPMIQMIDVLYSRALINSKNILWYSDTKLPDLGGNEDADFRRFFDQFDSNTEMTFPGFYKTHCVEIDITLLCMNSILQSEHIYEFNRIQTDKKKEDEVDFEQQRKMNKLSDEIESFECCENSFLRLKQVVNQWFEDCKKETKYSDVLLSHVYRWLSSGEAKLYDPQLFNFVNNLMQICFTELLKKIQACGSNLIFTSYNKIIIETKRTDFNQVDNYVKFLEKTIRKESMFKYLALEVTEEWAILLFKDKFNY